jgi:DNA-binding transcriptional ArsR family regulator
MSLTRPDRRAQELAGLFGLLSDPSRLSILLALRESPSNVTALCRRLKLSQPTVSHHLSVLRMGGLVQGRRRGKEVLYSHLALAARVRSVIRQLVNR